MKYGVATPVHLQLNVNQLNRNQQRDDIAFWGTEQHLPSLRTSRSPNRHHRRLPEGDQTKRANHVHRNLQNLIIIYCRRNESVDAVQNEPAPCSRWSYPICRRRNETGAPDADIRPIVKLMPLLRSIQLIVMKIVIAEFWRRGYEIIFVMDASVQCCNVN